MISMIETLIEKGYAYEKNGTVYYRTRKFAEYGKLSHKNLDDLQSGGRIGRSELIRGEVSRIEDVLAGYDSVTRDDILELARRIFDPAQASLAVVGNPGAEDEYRELLSKHL